MLEYFRRTDLALAGKAPSEMRATILAEIGAGTLKPPAAPAMAFMLSAEQWLGRAVGHWHPHVMLYLPFADVAAVGGAHDIESGLPLAFDFMGSGFATFVMQARQGSF
jgi:hypothetical protein